MPFHSAFLSLGGIIGTLISALVAFIAIVIADKLIAHNVEAKHALIMAIIALFLTPIVASLLLGALAISIPFFAPYILPLVIWIILGELLLKADAKTKLGVVVMAFVVYIILSMFLTPYLAGLLPSF